MQILTKYVIELGALHLDTITTTWHVCTILPFQNRIVFQLLPENCYFSKHGDKRDTSIYASLDCINTNINWIVYKVTYILYSGTIGEPHNSTFSDVIKQNESEFQGQESRNGAI